MWFVKRGLWYYNGRDETSANYRNLPYLVLVCHRKLPETIREDIQVLFFAVYHPMSKAFVFLTNRTKIVSTLLSSLFANDFLII